MLDFIYKLFGKFAGSKLKLEEGLPMDGKPWWKSKTILSDIVSILVVAYGAASTGLAAHLGHPLPIIPDWVFAVLAGIGIYGRTSAETVITK